MIPIIIHIFHASPLAANCLRTCAAALGNLLPHSNCSNIFALLLQGRKNASHRSLRSIQDFPWATTCTCHACRPHHCIIFAFVLNPDNVTAMYMILASLIGYSESSFCFAHGPTKLLPGILSHVTRQAFQRLLPQDGVYNCCQHAFCNGVCIHRNTLFPTTRSRRANSNSKDFDAMYGDRTYPGMITRRP